MHSFPFVSGASEHKTSSLGSPLLVSEGTKVNKSTYAREGESLGTRLEYVYTSTYMCPKISTTGC